MFCIVSFVVLSIMGIFSATNRSLAQEALDCVLRRVTFRPCTTGFDEKMKARILGSVITRSETAARVLNRNFELFAWTFFVIMLAASIMFLRGLLLFYTTGSCNGLNSSGFCVFDPAGTANEVSTGADCSIKPKNEADVSLKGLDLSSLPTIQGKDSNQIVMIGCYHCDYTRKAYPDVRALAQRYGTTLSYVNYPTKEKNDYFSRLSYCVNQQAPEKYWAFNDLMFSGDKAQLDDEAYMNKMLSGLGLNPDTVKFCTSDAQTGTLVQDQLNQVKNTHFYGTPTVFINGRAFVGPKPYRVYAINLKGLLYFMMR